MLRYCDIPQAKELRETTTSQDHEGPEGSARHHTLCSPQDMTNPTSTCSPTVIHLQLSVSVWASGAKEPLSMSICSTHKSSAGGQSYLLPPIYTPYLQNKQDFLSLVYNANYKKALCTTQGCSLYSTVWRCLKKPSLCPASCNALARDEQATLPVRPPPRLHPLCHKECWSNVLLPVKRTYVAKRQEMSQPRRR